MLLPDKSPVHRLVSVWWKNCRPPYRHELAVSRIFLWTAATREIEAHAAAGTFYDPLSDQRFLWASQWLDLAAGTRTAICPNTTALASLFFDPPLPPCHQHRAANDA